MAITGQGYSIAPAASFLTFNLGSIVEIMYFNPSFGPLLAQLVVSDC